MDRPWQGAQKPPPHAKGLEQKKKTSPKHIFIN